MRKLITIVLLSLAASMTAQETSTKGLLMLRDIDQRFVELDSLIFNGWEQDSIHPIYGQPFATFTPLGASAEDTLYNAAVGQRVRAQISEFKANTGIQLTGQAYYRVDGKIGIDEDDPVSTYSAKMQAEARWYFLQSALFKRRGQIKAIEIQGEIDRAVRDRDYRDVSVYAQKELFRHVNDSLLAGVLYHHITNLQMLSDSYMYLLESESVSSDELFKVLDEKAQAERMLATLRHQPVPASNLAGIDAYVVNVDTAAIIAHIMDTNVDMRILQLRLQQLDQQRDNTSFWSDARIAPFARYSYYLRDYAPNSANVDLGVSFTVPINGTAYKQRKVLEARKAELEAQGINILRDAIDRIHYYADEIDRLNNASLGEVRRISELKAYLQMRARAYDNRQGEYNRLARLKEYNNYIVCLEKLINFQYQRDCYVADLQKILTDGSILQYCTETQIMPLPASETTLSPIIGAEK